MQNRPLGLALAALSVGLFSACAGQSHALPQPAVMSADYVPGTTLAWNRILSSSLSESDRSLLKRDIENAPAPIRQSLTENTAVFVISVTGDSETTNTNRPELQGVLVRYQADPQGRPFATSDDGRVMPIVLTSDATAGPIHPAVVNHGPYRKILSVPGYQNVTATLTPDCQNHMVNGDSVFMYTGGYSSSGVAEFEAGISNVVTGDHQRDFVPYIRGVGLPIYYAINVPPKDVHDYGKTPYVYN